MNKIIYIILIIIVIGGMVLMFNKKDENIEKQSAIKYISMDEIVEIMNENKDYIILDVRTIEEYNEGHIPGAHCYPNEEIDENITNVIYQKDTTIYVYCRSGNRSKQASEKLVNLGYTNVIEIGGIIDYKGEMEY